MNNKILDKCNELIDVLNTSNLFFRYKELKNLVDNDSNIKDLTSKITLLKKKLCELNKNQIIDESLIFELDSLESRLNEIELFNEYLNYKDEVIDQINEINNLLKEEINK